MEPLEPSQSIKTVFPTSDAAVLGQAVEIVTEVKASRQYTDVANFSIRSSMSEVTLRTNRGSGTR